MQYTTLTISGETGIGKTRCTYLTVPKPCLVFQCEPTSFTSIPEASDPLYITKTAIEADPVQPIEDKLHWLLNLADDDPVKPKTLLWDGFGYWTQSVLDWHMENFKAVKAKTREEREPGRMIPQFDDYDAVVNRTRRFNRLVAQARIHIIYTCHIKKNVKLDKLDQDFDEYSPEIVGQSRSATIKTASEFSCAIKYGAGTPQWDFSAPYRLLHKNRVPLQRDESLGMMRFEPNYAVFLNAALHGLGWDQDRINVELATQYGSMKELVRVSKLKYDDMIK